MTKSFITLTILLAHSFVQGWTFFSFKEDPVTPIAPIPKKIIIIDPAGDAQNPGREIDDTCERALTFQLAQDLKSLIEEKNPALKVILTRTTGETLEPLQNVSFANRIVPELYLTVSLFESQDEKTSLFFYTLILDPSTDFFEKKESGLALIPFDQTYKLSLKKTNSYATQCYTLCKDAGKTQRISFHKPLAVPYKPLMGIVAPAVGIELGIRKQTDWRIISPLLAHAITQMVST